MAERLAYLEAVVGADITQFRKGMRDIRNEVGILSEVVGGISGAARTATFAISAPLATLGTYTVQAASDFDAAMRNINSITGMSEAQLKSLSDEVRAFSSTTRGGAVDAANSLYTVFSAGVTDIELAMNTMEVATKTADAGLADMETTTEALVASMLSYGTEVVSAERASDSLTQMVQIGVGSMQNFANSLSKALPSAAALGVEIEDLYASMAYMTQRSFSASEAATAINQGMSSLMKPTEDMENAMRSLGANGVEELMEKYNTLGAAVKALVDTTDGSSASIAKLFSNIRGKRFVDTILNDFDTYNKTLEEFNRTVEGATERAYAEQMKSFAAQWDLMTSAIENASIAIGLELLPVLTPVINKISEMFTAVSQLNPDILKLGVFMGGLLVVIPPLIWLLTSLLTPVGLLVTAVSALGASFLNNLGDIETAINNFVASVPALQTIVNDFNRMYELMNPPAPEDIVPEPIEVPLTESVIVPEENAASFIWTSWLNRSDSSFTWDEFKAEWEKANGTMVIRVGDLVEVPTGKTESVSAGEKPLSEQIEEAMRLGLGESAIMQIYKDWENEERKKLMAAAQFPTDALYMDTSGAQLPLETQFFVMQKSLEDNLIPAIKGTITNFTNWLDRNGSNMFDSLTQAMQLMVTGKLLGLFSTDILSEKVGEFFNIDVRTPFKNLISSFNTFLLNFGDWLVSVGLPVLFRGIGRFVSESANLGIKLLSKFGDFLKDVNLTTLANDIQYAIIDPFLQGFDDTFGILTGTILKIKFKLAGLKIVQGLTNIFDQIKSNFTVDSLSDFIGDIFDINPAKSMPTLFSALRTLADNIGSWLIDVGIPMVAKGAGRFISEVAILFVKGFANLTSLIGAGNFQTLIDTIVTPFTDGLKASFNTAFSFNDFVATFEKGVVNIITFIRNVFANLTQYISPTLIGDAIGLLFNLDDNTTILPNITANFSALLSDVGNWIITDGIPLLTYGIGRLWGELGILMGEGLAGLGTYIETGNFGNAAQGLADGFNDAMADSGVTGFDAYVTAFAGAIVFALGAVALYQGVGAAITTGITGALAIGKLITLPVRFGINLILTKVLGDAAVAAIATKGWGAWIATKLGTAVGATVATAGAKLAGGAGAVATGAKAVGAAVAGVSGAKLLAIVAVLVSLALILGAIFMSDDQKQSVSQGIADFFAGFGIGGGSSPTIETDINVAPTISDINPVASTFPYEVQTALQKLVDDGSYSMDDMSAAIDYLSIGLEEGADVSVDPNFWQQVFDKIANSYSLGESFSLSEEVPTVVGQFGEPTNDQFALEFSRNIINKLIEDLPEIIELTESQKAELQASGQQMGATMMREWVSGVQESIGGVGSETSDAVEDGVTDGASNGFQPILLETGEILVFQADIDEEQAEQVGAETLDLFTDAFNRGMTSEDYNAEVLVPFETNWLNLFGDEGTVKKAIVDFFTAFSVGMASLETQIAAASTGITEPATQICTKISTMADCIETSMISARDEVSNLLKELRKLASISTNLVISVSVTGTINVPEAADSNNNPRAKGVYTVPRNGWNATLHRGEMVIPANMADQIRDIGNVPSSTIGNVKSNSVNGAGVTNVYIEGVVSVDELMEELERRGIEL